MVMAPLRAVQFCHFLSARVMSHLPICLSGVWSVLFSTDIDFQLTELWTAVSLRYRVVPKQNISNHFWSKESDAEGRISGREIVPLTVATRMVLPSVQRPSA